MVVAAARRPPGEVLFPTIQQTVAGEVAWIGEEEGEEEARTRRPG